MGAESSRVQSYADRNGWAGGYHGAYFISSAPGATPIVAANSDFRYEPASSIKVLYLLYTLRQGVSLDSPITYYWTDSNTPDPNACPAKIPETARCLRGGPSAAETPPARDQGRHPRPFGIMMI